MKPTVLVSGSLAYDQIMDFPGYFKDNILPEKIHMLNVSFFIKQLRVSFGGTAGNIAYNLALLGLRPTALGNVGDDFGRYRQWLGRHGVGINQIKVMPGSRTATAFIITDQADNQISAFYPGALATPYKLRTTNYKLQAQLAIIAADNPANFLSLSTVYRQKKIPYIFDPGQQVALLSGSQIRRVTAGARVFISNDYELSLVLKKTGWSLAQLRRQVELVVTTLGGEGSVLYAGSKKIKVPPAKPKNTSDPTGAGDAYRAGLIYGLVNHWPLEKAGRFAGLVAVYTVEQYGTQTHTFTWAGLKRRYRQNFNELL